MPLTAQNLGQVAAIYIGTTPPINTTLIWYNTSVGVNSQFIYDTVTSTWVGLNVDFASDTEVSAGTVNNKAVSPLTLKNWWNTTNGEVKSNKVTSILGNETNVNQYPNNKAIADYIGYFYTNGVIPAIEGHIVNLSSLPSSTNVAPNCASVTYAIRDLGRICPIAVQVLTNTHTAFRFENIVANIHAADSNITISIPTGGDGFPAYGDVIYIRCGVPGTSSSSYVTYITGGITLTLNQNEWILVRCNGFIWEILESNKNIYNYLKPTGTDSQYVAGDGSLITFPTLVQDYLDPVSQSTAFSSNIVKFLLDQKADKDNPTLPDKNTPVDADTIGFFDSVASFSGVKTTLLNLWNNYIKPKTDAIYKQKLIGTFAQRNGLPNVYDGLEFYQTDMFVGLYLRKAGVWALVASAGNIKQTDLSFVSGMLTMTTAYPDASTITKFINNNANLATAQYSLNGGVSWTNITFVSNVATVSISMATNSNIMIRVTLAGANTDGTLTISANIN